MRSVAFAILLLLPLVAAGEPRVCSSFFEEIYQSPGREKLRTLLAEDALAARAPEARDEMIQVAKEMLDETGTRYAIVQLDGEPALKIYPGGSGRFAQLAKRIEAAYGAELLFAPAQTAKQVADGAAFIRPTENGKEVLAMGLSARNFSGANRPLRDPLVIHEMRHLKFAANRLRGRGSVYDVNISSLKGYLPGAKKGEPYNKYMSLEELKTQQHSVYAKAALLSRLLRLEQPAEIISSNLESLRYSIQVWETVLTRARVALEEGRAFVEKHPGQLGSWNDKKQLEAWLDIPMGKSTVRLFAGKPIKRGSSGNVNAFFTERLAAINEINELHLAQVARAKELAEKFGSAEGRERDRIAREILRALPVLKEP